ncbi:hypothetical protein H4R33_006624, partial [Dimargaris cristalligena]
PPSTWFPSALSPSLSWLSPSSLSRPTPFKTISPTCPSAKWKVVPVKMVMVLVPAGAPAGTAAGGSLA